MWPKPALSQAFFMSVNKAAAIKILKPKIYELILLSPLDSMSNPPGKSVTLPPNISGDHLPLPVFITHLVQLPVLPAMPSLLAGLSLSECKLGMVSHSTSQ